MAYQPTVPDVVISGNSSTSALESLAITGASYSGSSLVLTGTWSSVPGRVGQYYYVSGFTGAGTGNNSTLNGFICTAQGANTITLTCVGGYNGFTGSPTAAQMFIGTAVDVTVSPICAVSVFGISDQASASLGEMLQWSQDNTNWLDHIQAGTVTAGESCIVSDKVRARYFRVVYINGATSQSYFRLQCITSATNTSGTIRDLDTHVWGDDEAELVRAVISGKASPSASGYYTDVLTDVYGSLQTVVGGQAADAFGRVRIADPTTLFDCQFQYDTQPLLFQTSLVGSGTVAKTANESSLTLSTGGATSTWGAVNQTKSYFRYEPGKSQQVVMTGVLGAQKSNVRSRIGYFDANDGVYFEMDGTAGMSVNVRSSTSGSPVNTSIPQASWNFDKMDGTGPSGVVLDFSKTQIFTIDFQWLGVGRVRYGFFANGVLLICHQVYNNNVIASPYMNTANLPMRAEIFNTGAAGTATTMKQVCMTAISEGGAEYPQAYQFSAVSGVGNATATTTAVRNPLVSIQPKTTLNSIANRAKYRPVSVSVLCTPGATQPVYWELVYNATLAGSPSFASADPNSGVNVDVAASGTILTVTGSTYSGSTKVITGSWLGGANGQYVGQWITLTGFTSTVNNGVWLCTASAAGSISLTIVGGDNSIVGTPKAEGRGICIQSGLAVATDASIDVQLTSRIIMTLDITGATFDTLSLCATGLGSGAPGAWGSITWEEVR